MSMGQVMGWKGEESGAYSLGVSGLRRLEPPEFLTCGRCSAHSRANLSER